MQRNYEILGTTPCTNNNGGYVQVLNVRIITVPELHRSLSSLTSLGKGTHKQIETLSFVSLTGGQLKQCLLSSLLSFFFQRSRETEGQGAARTW